MTIRGDEQREVRSGGEALLKKPGGWLLRRRLGWTTERTSDGSRVDFLRLRRRRLR